MSNNIIWNLFFYTIRTSCFSSFGVIFGPRFLPTVFFDVRSYRLFPLESRDSEAFLVRKLLFWCTASLTRSMSVLRSDSCKYTNVEHLVRSCEYTNRLEASIELRTQFNQVGYLLTHIYMCQSLVRVQCKLSSVTGRED